MSGCKIFCGKWILEKSVHIKFCIKKLRIMQHFNALRNTQYGIRNMEYIVRIPYCVLFEIIAPALKRILNISLFLLCLFSSSAWPQMDDYAPGAVHSNTSQPGHYKFYGEYGLWVEMKEREIVVHWITAREDSGFLYVFQDENPLHSITTSIGLAHRAAFALQDRQDITIHYGSLDNPADHHQTTLFLSRDPERPPVQVDGVDSLLVVGDVHGEYDTLVRLLTNAKILNSDLSWRAKRAHLIFMGDLFDRGDDVVKTLWFLYRLEKEAQARGGRVHILLGNHEVMAFLNDLRYTSEKEQMIAQRHGVGYTGMFDIRESVLGSWLASKPGMLKINNILLAHGGVSLPFSVHSLNSFNDSLYAYLHEKEFPSLLRDGVSTVRGDATLYARRLYFFFGDNSVFWFRGYVLSDTLKKELNKVLDKFSARHHVVAHTPVPHIRAFYGDKIFAVDLHKPASELLLFVRTTYRYKIYRYPTEGKAEPLENI